MSKVAVVYWTGTGNTEAMANAVVSAAEGKGAEVTVVSSDYEAFAPADYDAVALGCPAMGDEVLEEDEFQPMYDRIKADLVGKKVAIFGSYGWGDGQWIRDWKDDIEAAGVTLAVEPVMANDAPDDDAIAELTALAEALV